MKRLFFNKVSGQFMKESTLARSHTNAITVTSRINSVRHERTQTGEEPYKCSHYSISCINIKVATLKH